MSKSIIKISEDEKKVEDVHEKHPVLEVTPSKISPTEESTQPSNKFSSENKVQESCSIEKKPERYKNVRRKSSEPFKQDGNPVPESRLLRSHTPQKKSSPLKAESAANPNIESTTNKQKKIRQNARASVKDDASRIKMRVKYFLNRINREQSLIDAYSADGWKGQSHEKVRPEQELRRAERQILQCKLGIRKEIEQIQNLSLEGSIQEAAFDEEGQIYFDDIFCAICKSKEVFPENDIILCDGACDRAFHQFCLDPPLKTEDIPPGDEGWLCPICDCKFECFDAINDYLGTDFDIEDSWKKVFAEVEEDSNFGGNGAIAQVDWPSEDSEDDDYNPVKPKLSEQDGSSKENEENDDNDSDLGSGSSSDSDSGSSNSSGVVFFDEFAGSSKGNKRARSNGDETEELSEEDVVMVSGKRQRPDVDYKQLHDEVFGVNASNESSEDEDWGKRKRKKDIKEPDQQKEGLASEVKSETGKTGKLGLSRRSSARISKEILSKLQEVFKECELPSKDRKQNLSSELGLSFEDVNTWFRNSRRNIERKRKLGSKLDTSTNIGSGKNEATSADSGQDNGILMDRHID